MVDPNIQPVWLDYDKDKKSLFIMTGKKSKRAQNIRKKSNVYFSIDDGNIPYKGVKGKGVVIILEDPKTVIPTVEKINLKYFGTLDHPVARTLTDRAKKGEVVVIEISPKFFSTWDYGKMQP
jgi:general stress protein 26